jgi:hypothetical protein
MSASLTSGKSVSAPAEIEIQLTGSYNHSHHHHRDSDDKPKSALVKDEKTKREATLMDFGTNLYQHPFELHILKDFWLLCLVISKIDEAVRGSIPLESMKLVNVLA